MASPRTQEKAEGLILGVIGFILFFDFAAIDASIFGYNAPQWMQSLSNAFSVSPLMIDLLTTIALLTLIAMLRTERQIGAGKRL